MTKWIQDFISPITLKSPTVSLSTEFIRNVLVVIKSQENDTNWVTITSKPTTSISRTIDSLFNEGVNKVSYIKLTDLTLKDFLLNDSFFTILFDGFSKEEIEARDLGSYTGVIGYEVTEKTEGIIENVKRVYCKPEDVATKGGANLGVFFGITLSGRSLALATPITTDVSYIDNLGDANDLFEKKISCIGKDEAFNIRVITYFIGKFPTTKPYIEKEMLIKIQENNANLISQGLDFTSLDASIVTNYNTNYIIKYYVNTKKIEDFTYKATMSNTQGIFDSILDTKPMYPLYKIVTVVGEMLNV